MDPGFSRVELSLEVLAVGAELGAALVDVAEQVGVGVIDEFEAADGALDALVGVADRAT
ncbi:hypothetical protein [Pseudonocardia kunmingensis]|uniref:hypothetical protein n=1 Tax=Pseudonocardia kunmingensis TaxID=630975 RepID=UPI0014781369|nr:hypothetical protein [Pseudonocardia kunmingensis]